MQVVDSSAQVQSPLMPPSQDSEAPSRLFSLPAYNPLGEYMIDAAQRTILFWDVWRRRSEDFYAHRAMDIPHVLNFDTELILDGRLLPRPANYFLERIKPLPGTQIDPQKRPFMVIDPRAGHGPGIGGFKAESEIGVAARAGHACYFVGFTPDPVPGQTIEDIMRVEERFLEKVIELHPQADGKPCVIGNCQAGWAVMMLAAVRPDLFGPIIVPGAPLSYWAGVKGQNPMRYAGGLLGGSWLTAFTSDLGQGAFDGKNLVDNFESLNPAHTYWGKNYKLWSKIDTEAQRFLNFERWWGGHVTLNGEEIQWIVDQLFIGNRLATAEITTRDGVRVDLRNIRSPILCFSSEKDNITPPQQSLGWIVDLYEDDDDILAHEQTIVYSIHQSVGHLGIFVSESVAKKEHQKFASNIDLIDILPPGIYEAVMVSKAEVKTGADLASGDWVVRLERRTLADVRAIVQPDADDERRFATVKRLSATNLGLYRMLVQPCVRALVKGAGDGAAGKLRSAEQPYVLFSAKNPFMQQVEDLAKWVREQRLQSTTDNPFVKLQERVSAQVITSLEGWQQLRDQSQEQLFLAVYGNPLLQALVGLLASEEPPRRHPGREPEEIDYMKQRIAQIKEQIAEGGAREAVIRALAYISLGGDAIDERQFTVLEQIRAEEGRGMSLDEFKQTLRKQFFSVLLDQEGALAAISTMLPEDSTVRKESLESLRRVVTASGELQGGRAKRFAEITALFEATV